MNEVKDVAWHSRGGQRAKSLTTPHSGRPEISPPPTSKNVHPAPVPGLYVTFQAQDHSTASCGASSAERVALEPVDLLL